MNHTLELPSKREIRKDPQGHTLALVGLSLEKLERVKKKMAMKIAELLEYQWETWAETLGRNKRAYLRQNLHRIARAVLERTKGREIGEKIPLHEIKAFMGIKI